MSTSRKRTTDVDSSCETFFPNLYYRFSYVVILFASDNAAEIFSVS